MRIGTIIVSAVTTAALAFGCGGKTNKSTNTTTTTSTGEAPLYNRLGGIDAIKLVVHQMVENIKVDARINTFFANADLPHLEAMLSDQICGATGGPCAYKGKNMREAHAGMGVKEEDFNALVEDLVKALDQYKVPEKEKTELLGALGAMKPDIVAIPAGAGSA